MKRKKIGIDQVGKFYATNLHLVDADLVILTSSYLHLVDTDLAMHKACPHLS